MPSSIENKMITNAAFSRVGLLERLYGDDIPWSAIEEGFLFNSEKVYLANKARGIFKPKQFNSGLLSIKTTIPRKGRLNVYSDSEDEGFFRYSLQSGDPYLGGNRHLWEALEDKSPFIYFHAVAEGRYKAMWPCFISAIRPDERYCEVVVGMSSAKKSMNVGKVEYTLPDSPELKYAVRESRVRLYQATFRENVLKAYDNRCAISGLPVPELLEAAHITPDTDMDCTTDICNGIALSRIHHRAFDGELIGISPDYDVVVSERLLSVSDGVILSAMQSCHNAKLLVPKHRNAKPDRDRLAARFEVFLQANGLR